MVPARLVLTRLRLELLKVGVCQSSSGIATIEFHTAGPQHGRKPAEQTILDYVISDYHICDNIDQHFK